jgi:hypothetical protein
MLRPDWEQSSKSSEENAAKQNRGLQKEHDENLVFNTTSVSK